MADPTLNINVKADTSQAQRAFGSFKGSFTELKSQLDLAIIGLQAFKDAAVKAFELAKEGAELERIRGQLDNLAVSIGTTSDSIIKNMTDASGGLMTNAEMISAATQIISLGLADNETDVIRLATIVSELGWDMQQVILTFANNSTMRLDALGLSVQDVTEKAKAFEEQGFDADKAFDLAVLAAGEEKIGLIGSQAETAAGQFKIFENNIKNANDQLKIMASQALLPAIQYHNDNAAAIKLANEALLKMVITEEQYDNIVNRSKGQQARTEAITAATEALYWFNLEAERDKERLMAIGDVLRPTVEEFEWFTDATELYGSAAIHARNSMAGAPKAIREIGDAAEEAEPSLADLADSTRDLGDTNAGILGFIEDTIEAIKQYADPEFLQAKLIMEELIALWESGEIPLSTLKTYAEDLHETLTAGEPVADSAAAHYLGLGDDAGYAADELGRMRDNIDEIEGNHEVNIDVTVTGDPIPSLPGNTRAPGSGRGGKTGTAFHDGADFVVPPGYPNDSYGPIFVESGERVTVTPAGQMGGAVSTSSVPQVIVMLDGEQIAAHVLTRAGTGYRQSRANGGGYTGR